MSSMNEHRAAHAQPEAASPPPDETRVPVVRAGVAGVLMGLANLVPGVSGGTMILVCGLFDDFIAAVADTTRLKLSVRNATLLGIIVGAAGVAIVALSGTLSRMVTLHESAMFSLFIGLTLGGVPLLWRMIGKVTPGVAIGALAGLGLMIAIAATRSEPPDKEAVRAAVRAGTFVIERNYGLDFLAGVLGLSAMVLPGISGAYMLLILGRYETILASISQAKRYVTSDGEGASTEFVHVIAPTAIGAILSIVALSNLLKWLLKAHEKPTLGVLLGIVLGSVVGIWPFSGESSAQDVGLGAILAVGGFVATYALSRLTK